MPGKPPWLRAPSTGGDDVSRLMVEAVLRDLSLNTVCREARCPNRRECFSRKVATVLIMGTHCTRNCRFCNVRNDLPLPLDPEEPRRVAEAARRLGLRYVVVTSVTRDDLPDGGAAHFAATIREIRELVPSMAIEVLIPDFRGDAAALRVVAQARPAVISHNVETVPALYEAVRPQADYRQSLRLLENIKKEDPGIRSKTGIMLGLGESRAQVLEVLTDLRRAGCEFLTLGQYLAPGRQHHPVREYVHPDVFAEYKNIAQGMGFLSVASAPLVRSSFHAEEALGMRF
ncbi:MAG: lipoyl synthase [Desulfovibrio sp.]|nr:lipoyl synthase [Desulfovibrio sp.]